MARRYMDIYHHLLHPRKPLALLPGNAAAIGAGAVAATGVGAGVSGLTAASHAATVIAGGAL
jgi:hypothetical protein